jgi:hypothetical protein
MNNTMQRTLDNASKKMRANFDRALKQTVKNSADVRNALRNELRSLDPSVLKSVGWKKVVEDLANAEE